MKQIRLQQGDSFPINFIIEENGVPSNIRPGEDIVMGFYNEAGCGCGLVLKYSNGGIVADRRNPGYYTAFVSHEMTKNFVGNVDLEITVCNNTKNIVAHADKIISLYFEERQNNYII